MVEEYDLRADKLLQDLDVAIPQIMAELKNSVRLSSRGRMRSRVRNKYLFSYIKDKATGALSIARSVGGKIVHFTKAAFEAAYNKIAAVGS